MKRSRRDAAARGSSHLARLSLPAFRPPEPFEGSEILREIPEAPAFLLCQAYRSVMAWALVPAAEREGMFAPGAADAVRERVRGTPMADGMRVALEVVCNLLADPAGADPRRVSAACVSVAEWAEERGSAPSTSIRFMQAAATCASDDSRLAYRAGCVARKQAVWETAELWFRHAISVGRRNHDWEAHATAYLGLGNNYYNQGRYAPARREHMKALRVSRRHGLRELQGRAYHDLLAMAIMTGDAAAAETFGPRAFYAYGPTHENVPLLAQDIAYFWITQGEFGRALRVYQALRPHLRQSDGRVRGLGVLGRAAGECARPDVFEDAWAELWRMAPAAENSSALSPSLLQLAHGAVRLGDWDRAEQAARYALRVAGPRGETDVIAEAEELLTVVRDRSPVPVLHAPEAPGSGEAETLASDLVASLEACAAAV